MKELQIKRTEAEYLEIAKSVNGKTIKDIVGQEKIDSKTKRNKGLMGQFAETEIFKIPNNSRNEYDFIDAKLELKVSPLNRNKKNNNWAPKERIKLSMINFPDLIDNKNIEDSNFWNKNQKILFMWYLYNHQFELNKFIDSVIYDFNDSPFYKTLSNDWTILRNKILEGKGHEISEKDTNFLGAVRSGPGGKKEKKIPLPNSNEFMWRRAFCLKIKCVRCMVDNILNKKENQLNSYNDFQIQFEKKLSLLKGKRIKDLMTIDEIEKWNSSQEKSILPRVICNYINKDIKSFKQLSEYLQKNTFEKFTFKTIPLIKDKNNNLLIKEKFKLNFDINKAAKQKLEWDETELSKILENKFYVITYLHETNNRLNSIIQNVKEINFKDQDIVPFIYAYNEYVKRFYEGNLADNNGNVNFLKSTDNKTVHFRPSAKNGTDTFITAAGEKVLKSKMWINDNVVKKLIF